MKSITSIIFFCLFITFLLLPSLADSPLTSSAFYEAYTDVPMVKEAQGELMNEKIFNFLTASENPIDEKMAVINAMGWNIDGHHNGKSFIDLIGKKLNRKTVDLKIKDLTSDEIMCLGYLLAMDDYFSMGPAKKTGGELETASSLKLLDEAVKTEPDNFTFQLINSLVKAQVLLSNDWPGVYLTVNKAVTSNLERNMREDGINIIMDYINGYKKYCDNKSVMDSAIKIKPVKNIEVSQGINSIYISPDGKKLISVSGNESAVRLWSTDTFQQLIPLDSGEFTDCHIFSPDGNWILISDWVPQVLIYSSSNYSHVKELQFSSRIMDIAFSSSGDKIVFACFNGSVEIYNKSTWQKEAFLQAHREYVSTVQFSKDGKYLLTGGYDYSVKLWDMKNNCSLIYEKKFTDGTFASFLPGDKQILMRDYSGNIEVLDTATGESLWEKIVPATVHDIVSDGSLIAAATEIGVIYLWDWKKNKGPVIFKAHEDQVTGLALSPDGKSLYSCGLDNRLITWNLKELKNKIVTGK